MGVASAVLAMLVAAPWFATHDRPTLAALIYQAFSPLCHQVVERSFRFGDAPLAVCARCTGVYAGLLLGLVVYPLWRRLDDERMPGRLLL